MFTRIANLWNRVRSSLWFIPTLMSIAAFALARVASHLDGALSTSQAGWLRALLYIGDHDGARGLLSTVAGSMITVAGVTFSVTVVALSLASSQFGPRLLLNFMRDRSNQLVLGTFISTFLYCLVALSSVSQTSVVPAASASIGLGLALASVAVLIYFIHHMSTAIRAEHVVDVVARDLAAAIERLFPDGSAAERDLERDERAGDARVDPADAEEVLVRGNGYIQAIDESGLVATASAADVVVQLLRRPGHFVVADEPLALVAPKRQLTPELAEQIHRHVLVGRTRTDEQDPEYGIHQLVEVAVRALSPGINDPNTAISCVDWLGSALHRIAGQRLRTPVRRDGDGNPRLISDPITFDGLLGAAFDQIRQASYATPAVSIRILELLASIARVVDDPERAAAVREQADVLLAGAVNAGIQKTDREDLERRHRAVIDALEA